ncbi:hypothetical protein [Rhodanobacter denitrificans]|uniref:Uncharacterized protein n=2 Tax=Pseudomonadota TaxID=1224 RepID=M4NG85_9GAMM|nr:hypothetical protein [Rhodanobacter denitrificans]AGG89092.1 hypothetical protein R2APBS1_1969 [Rhodanobacter denitrificans]UJJ53119.1 hypothetical protein LRK52_18610 [Rhodanobacter denitrificans]
MHHVRHVLAIPALHAVVAATLDRGIHYQDDFAEACHGAWIAALPLVDEELEAVVVRTDLGETFESRRDRGRALKERLAGAPRGTWAVIEEHMAGHKVHFNALMSVGDGQVECRGDGWGSRPTFKAMCTRLVGMEVYLARCKVEEERRQESGRTIIQTRGLAEGGRLRAIRLEGVVYSSATIESVAMDKGRVTLTCARRGSAKRRVISAYASAITFLETKASAAKAARPSSVA